MDGIPEIGGEFKWQLGLNGKLDRILWRYFLNCSLANPQRPWLIVRIKPAYLE
jgi:hypothetical protein